jgi:hypothetical protein
MSFKVYLFRMAMKKTDEAELRTFFNFVAMPDQEFTASLFEDWVFEMSNVDVWDSAVGASDFQTLHEFINEFEDKIMDNFLKAASNNVVYLDDKITEDDETDRLYFREIICSMYMYIYGDYINTVFQDFDLVAKRVYQELFDEPEESDEGCEDPLSN